MMAKKGGWRMLLDVRTYTWNYIATKCTDEQQQQQQQHQLVLLYSEKIITGHIWKKTWTKEMRRQAGRQWMKRAVVEGGDPSSAPLLLHDIKK